MGGKGRVCLAYSGGLDTSVILAWLIREGYEVVAFCADVGQEEDFMAVEAKAKKVGALKLIVVDLRKIFVEEMCFTAIRCNAIYEGRYLLGTSLARPVIARAQMQIAEQEKCQYVSHGCTGKGNDQVRFELAFNAIKPNIGIIAPWRDPAFVRQFQGRQQLLDFAAENGIPVTSTKSKPWSMDENLAHCSYEAGMLENPDTTPPDDMWKLTVSPESAPDKPTDITIHFMKGLPVKVDTPEKSVTGSLSLFLELNELGRVNGIGRIDIVENRYIGLKSRGCYDTPALTILRLAHLDLEGLVLDPAIRSRRDQWITHDWSQLVYNGLYFSPEREWIQSSLVSCQDPVNGEVRLRLYKGNCYVLGRKSDNAVGLYSAEEASMDSLENFSVTDTSGFLGIQSIRLKKYGLQKIQAGQAL